MRVAKLIGGSGVEMARFKGQLRTECYVFVFVESYMLVVNVYLCLPSSLGACRLVVGSGVELARFNGQLRTECYVYVFIESYSLDVK